MPALTLLVSAGAILIRSMKAISQANTIDRFIRLVGRKSWQQRIDEIVAAQPVAGQPTLCGRDVLRRHSVEVVLERRRRPSAGDVATCDQRILHLAQDAIELHASLPTDGRRRFEQRMESAMLDGQTLMPLFHLLRTAWLHRGRGFEVSFCGLTENAPYDLCLTRDGKAAEVACDTVSAEHGRGVHSAAWNRLVDSVFGAVGPWLGSHPGLHLLKMTLPRGLRNDPDGADREALRGRVMRLLDENRRADTDPDAVIRLDPLTLLSRARSEVAVMAHLRAQFGPDTQLAVKVAPSGAVFAMAAHAGRENDVATAVARRLSELAPRRLTGTRPGILAMFVDDTDLSEWRRLQTEMRLEAETRQFLTTPEARHVVSVACTSRHELFDRNCADGEFRFRNPRHLAAKIEALAPSILSSN